MRRLGLDRVLFIPSAAPPHKRSRRLASPADRLKMVRLAVGCRRRFAVSPLEMKRHGPSFTFDTVRAMRRRFPLADIYFIIGTDTIRELRTWHRYRDLLGEVRFAAVARPGYPFSRRLGPIEKRLILLPTGGLNVSSTALRSQLARGRFPSALPRPVRDYIRRRGLYRHR